MPATRAFAAGLLAFAGITLAGALAWGAWSEYRVFTLRRAAQADLGVARLERALERLHQAERLAPGNARLHGEIGRVTLMLARWRADPAAAERALAAHARAIAHNPRDATLHAEFGWALMRLQRPHDAAAAFAAALALDPSNAYYLSSLGRAHEAAGDIASARAAYERSLATLPTREVRDLLRALDER